MAQRLAYGKPPEGGPASLDEIELVELDGRPLDPSVWKGRVVLFVNVASKCGLTPQYQGLQALFDRYADRGFTIVGAPCNQFLGQEPGTPEQIASFCSLTYGVTFPLLAKQEVNGAGRSALYRWLIGSEAGGGGDITWNFEKFLVGRDGTVARRFSPRVEPLADEVVAAVEEALASP
ncbi:MAG: glutathione peroxidase [Alphaproteobacteria bacterium]|nr:glutathione peroxidase [Alphaproteobacteria bacterium]MCB9698637.1 glutathione peroxidase [Alphaproteobacteria bacterium]